MAHTEFTMKPELFPLLAYLAGQGVRPLSPWARVEPAAAIDAGQWRELEEAGLCAGAGQLQEQVLVAIRELREPTRFVRLRLMSGPTVVEHMVYYCGTQDQPISLTVTRDGLLVRNPAPLRLILQGLAEYWGHSQLVSNRMNLRLDRPQALVLAAMIDLHRRQVLADRAAMRTPGSRSYSVTEVHQALQSTPSDGQWLVAVVRAFTGLETEVLVDAVAAALTRLVAQQVATEVDGRFELAFEGLACANNLLLLSQVLRLEIGNQIDGELVVRSGMLCLQAGLHDNLYVDREDGQVVLESVSARFICEMMETFLQERFTAEADAQAEEDLTQQTHSS